MGNRDLMNKMLGERWVKTSAPAAGTTAVATVSAPIEPQARHHLETLIYSIRNFVGAGGAAATVGLQVRAGAGTVLASIDHLIPASTTANVAMSNLGIPGKRGSAMDVYMNTVVASLTQKVNIAGWTENS